MRKQLCLIIIAILVCWITAVAAPASDAASIPRISKEKAKVMLGKRNVVVVDVRVGPAWDKEDLKIKGAMRRDPQKIETWFSTIPKKKTLIFYCA